MSEPTGGPNDRSVAAARAAIRAGQLDRAEAVLERVVASAPGDRQAQYLLGLARHRAGRPTEALEPFRTLTALAPDDARSWFALGTALEAAGQPDRAEDAFARCRALEPTVEPGGAAPNAPRPHGGPGDGSPAAPPAAPADQVLSGPGTLAAGLEQSPGDAGHGTLLVSGGRRLGSSLGAVLLGAIVAVAGVLLAVLRPSALAGLLARWSMLGRSPDVLRSRLRDAQDLGFGEGEGSPVAVLEAEVARAVQVLDDRAAVAASALTVVGLLIAALGVLIALGGVLRARATRYDVYTHAIDITRGVLNRRTDTVWLYEVTDAVYERPLSLLLSGDARIVLHCEDRAHTVVALQGADQMRRLWAELRDAALRERRAMRRWWV
ncbi:tetratricopeptide repeat protein [Actinotalea sp. M2MS4P-6]|uniref:tetratricopeptide repeat protein n=1 Tax=Actinotalea sp. M2MS4P-6 TaxID=2983762 RepID=UPI0021E47D66|nr:tetratricopeptide repeat protein [Actinotalea sp. M2MS4P-6]MCV2394666.1 tetratricopeptide repeat protein [Actinotalea sp. M2MS4P-6]